MLVKATRSRVKDIIGTEVRKLELELMRLTKLTSEPVKSGEEPPKKTRPQIQTKTIHTYGKTNPFDVFHFSAAFDLFYMNKVNNKATLAG